MPPVDDVPVHPRTRHDKVVAGCHSSAPPKSHYFVLERQYTHEGRYHLEDRWIEHRMSLTCRKIGRKFNGAWVPLGECMGGTSPKDEAYITKARNDIDKEFVK